MLRLSVLLLVFTFAAQWGVYHFWPQVTYTSLIASMLIALAFIAATNFIWKVDLDDLMSAAKEEATNEDIPRMDGDDWW